jgi:type I restriction enzyme S subunit
VGSGKKKKLGEIVIYKNGKAHENSVVENGDYVIVNSKFISTDGKVAKYSNDLLCPVGRNEILMVLSDVPNGRAIAKCFFSRQK